MTQQIDCYILLKVHALVKMVFTITLFSTFTTIQTCWRILNIVLFYYVLFRPPSFWKRFCPVLNSPRNSDIIDIFFFLLIHYLKVILIRQVLNSQIDNKSEQKGENKIFLNFRICMSKIMFKLMSTCHLGPRPPVDTQFQTNRRDRHTYNPRPRIRHFDNILGLCNALK